MNKISKSMHGVKNVLHLRQAQVVWHQLVTYVAWHVIYWFVMSQRIALSQGFQGPIALHGSDLWVIVNDARLQHNLRLLHTNSIRSSRMWAFASPSTSPYQRNTCPKHKLVISWQMPNVCFAAPNPRPLPLHLLPALCASPKRTSVMLLGSLWDLPRCNTQSSSSPSEDAMMTRKAQIQDGKAWAPPAKVTGIQRWSRFNVVGPLQLHLLVPDKKQRWGNPLRAQHHAPFRCCKEIL